MVVCVAQGPWQVTPHRWDFICAFRMVQPQHLIHKLYWTYLIKYCLMMCITSIREAGAKGSMFLPLDWFVLPHIDQSGFQWLGTWASCWRLFQNDQRCKITSVQRIDQKSSLGKRNSGRRVCYWSIKLWLGKLKMGHLFTDFSQASTVR